MTDIGIPAKAVAPTERAGVPSTAIFGGYVQSNERSSELIGRNRYKTFAEILANTSIVAASVRHYLNLLGNAGWRVEPAEKRGGERVAKLVEQTLMRDMETPWHRVVRRGAMYRFYGFSLQEWTARAGEKGWITYDDVESRSQNTITKWDVDQKNGEVRGVVQESPWDGRELYIPRSKMLYLVDDSLSDSPEGLGMFRHIVDPARRLKIYQDLECFGYETDLRGIPVGRAPIEQMRQAGMSKKDITAAMEGLVGFLDGHRRSPQLSLLLDSITYETEDDAATPSSNRQWDVELLKAPVQGHESVAVAIERLNREIARSLGSETLLTGENGSGSLAMARDKSQTFALTVSASLQEMTAVLERDLIGPLMLMNGIDKSLWPTLKPDAIQHRSVTEITAALKDLALNGFMLAPGDPVIDKLMELLGMPKASPEVKEQRKLVAQPAPMNGKPGQGEDEPKPASGKKPAPKSKGQE